MSKSHSKFKLAIIMRTDLQMGKGKLCVEAAHASILAYRNQFKYEGEASSALYTVNQAAREWLEEGQFKVVLQPPKDTKGSETKLDQEGWLLSVASQARHAGLPVVEVRDFGFTGGFPPNTLTCIGIGPSLISDIDKITKGLTLL